jgi:hypothetical protein
MPSLDRADQHTAQRYAECMRMPYLPLAAGLQGKAKQCAPDRPAKGPAKKATEWVTHIATNFPGCETRLTITRE